MIWCGKYTRWRFVGGAPYTAISSASYYKSVWDITKQPILDYSNFNKNRLPDTHQLDLRIDKEFYFKKWVLNFYTDIQNVYNFKTQGAPNYTNLDNGVPDANGNKVYSPVSDPTDPSKYVLRNIDNFAGTILPTIGIIIKI